MNIYLDLVYNMKALIKPIMLDPKSILNMI